MKHLVRILGMFVVSITFLSCNNYVNNSCEKDVFAKGADVSWLAEMEADAVKFMKKSGEEADCYEVLKECGINAIRLRVWVDSSKSPYMSKVCDKESVVRNAKRALNHNLDVMIDFHYSDWFADPSKQHTPADWKNLSFNELKQALVTHTKDVLNALKEAGVSPKWVQVGNETRPGMLHPIGQLWNEEGELPGGWDRYVELSNAGYDAVKLVFPEAMAMIHIDNAWDKETNSWWLNEFSKRGGKTDMIALSHYPQAHPANSWQQMNQLALDNLLLWADTYKMPVMISEVGVKPETEEAVDVLKDFMQKMHRAADGKCMGVFYWEPQVFGGWKPSCYEDLGWPYYDMGGFTADGQCGEIMDALCGDYAN